MAYGQNKSFGLQSVDSLIGGFNGQTSRYYIKSGYEYNIFQGDLVYLGTDGFIHNLYDLGIAAYVTYPALGVFNGCSFVTPSAANPIAPATAAKPFWPAGTVTNNGAPASCFIIDDPNVLFSIQSGVAGLSWTAQGKTAQISYTDPAGGFGPGGPVGNTQTGQSLMVLNPAVGNTATWNLKIKQFDDSPLQTPPVPDGAAVPYVTAIVMIQIHFWTQRAAGATQP